MGEELSGSRFEVRRGKFNSARDSVLYDMSLQGWANESSGDVASNTGYFSRISNTAPELAEVERAFEEELQREGLNVGALEGHYLLVEDDQGFVHVAKFDSEAEVKEEYDALDEAYGDWMDGGDDVA
jgi:hypothetical protein